MSLSPCPGLPLPSALNSSQQFSQLKCSDFGIQILYLRKLLHTWAFNSCNAVPPSALDFPRASPASESKTQSEAGLPVPVAVPDFGDPDSPNSVHKRENSRTRLSNGLRGEVPSVARFVSEEANPVQVRSKLGAKTGSLFQKPGSVPATSSKHPSKLGQFCGGGSSS